MDLVDVIEIAGGRGDKRIELLMGDLTDIPQAHAVDVLVVSAFPGDYSPTPNSLIGGLYRKRLSVADLWIHNEVDLRKTHSCWLSREIAEQQPGLMFKRVLCFEPEVRGRPPEVVGDIFRALAPFTLAEPHIRSIAMPIVAAGDQGYSVADMLPPLLDAAANWLREGFPIDTIKLVVRSASTAAQAKEIFQRYGEGTSGKSKAELKKSAPWDLSSLFRRSAKPAEPPAASADRKVRAKYDVFVSYSRVDEDAARHLERALTKLGLRVFLDKSEIDIGVSWQQKIFEALEECTATAALYSPSFLASKVCQDEFTVAFMRRRETDAILLPLLIQDTELPTYMRILNYIDCRASDVPKIEAAAVSLATALRKSA